MKLDSFIKKSHFKPLDGLIILCLILLSFLPLLLFTLKEKPNTKNVTYEAVLSVEGKVIQHFPLSKDTSFTYKDSKGAFNTIEVKNQKVHIEDANCGDLVCVRKGWIAKSGETIVCLPHKLLVEIKASDGTQEGNLIY